MKNGKFEVGDEVKVVNSSQWKGRRGVLSANTGPGAMTYPLYLSEIGETFTEDGFFHNGSRNIRLRLIKSVRTKKVRKSFFHPGDRVIYIDPTTPKENELGVIKSTDPRGADAAYPIGVLLDSGTIITARKDGKVAPFSSVPSFIARVPKSFKLK